MAETPFVWGRGGQKLTPAQVEREREAAALLAKGAMDFSPVQHWSQGLGRVAQGLLAGIDYRMADKADADIAATNKELIANLLAGGSTPSAGTTAVPMSGAAGEIAATSPAAQPIDLSGNEVYNQFIGAAREGGLTNPYGLAALAATGKAESGFDPGNVNRTWSDPSQSGQPGTAGGILSWRGPRYQALAATGDLSPAGQARFFLQEDPGLVQALNNAKSVEEAQSLINNAWKFAGYDRADGETARRLGLARSFLPTFQGGGEVAAATPEAAIEAIAPLQPVERGPLPASSYAGQERVPPQSLSEEVAAYQQTPEYAAAFPGRQQPASSVQPVQVAGGGDRVPMASASTGINPAIIEALTNPQASPQTQRLAGILLEQEQRRAMAQEEQRIQAADPMRQIELESAQIKLDQLRNPGPQPLINAGGGAVYNPNTKEWLTAPSNGQEPPKVVELFDEATGQPYKATWNAEAGQYERVGGVKARSGMQLTTNPDGTVTLTEGAIGGLPKLTEAEGRNSGFYGRGVESQKILNSLEGEGTSLFNKIVGGVPVVGNYLKGEEAQKYGQAKRDFINAVLRRESGAVISPEEFANADQQYFPQPGDGPEVIEQKRQNRETTIQGLKISAGQGAAFAVPSQQGAGERKRLKFNPATGELE